MTGVLESLHRNEAEELVKKYGGKVTQAVSSKTTYLLAGEDAGPSKLSKVSPPCITDHCSKLFVGVVLVI